MGREALITINCERYSKRIIDIVDLLFQIGWCSRNKKGAVEYLPVGDKDEYNWQEQQISDDEVNLIINKKQDENEMVGLALYYQNSIEGLILLAKNTKEIMLDLDINRRKMGEDRDAITDIGWYFDNLIQKIIERGCSIDSIQFEDYID